MAKPDNPANIVMYMDNSYSYLIFSMPTLYWSIEYCGLVMCITRRDTLPRIRAAMYIIDISSHVHNICMLARVFFVT